MVSALLNGVSGLFITPTLTNGNLKLSLDSEQIILRNLPGSWATGQMAE